MSPEPTSQFLLARKPGTSTSEFRSSWLRHGHLVLPWCLARGVTYYAQIHSPTWSSEPHNDIDLSQWDGAAEMVFGEAPHDEHLKVTRDYYYKTVILADERRFLVDEALKHGKAIAAGSVVGEKVEFIRDGKPVVSEESWKEWKTMFDEMLAD